jgi:hypothetical protein
MICHGWVVCKASGWHGMVWHGMAWHGMAQLIYCWSTYLHIKQYDGSISFTDDQEVMISNGFGKRVIQVMYFKTFSSLHIAQSTDVNTITDTRVVVVVDGTWHMAHST